MKIICKKIDLSESINIVLKAVSSKSTMSILECIVINATDSITMTTNNMELGIQTKVVGNIVDQGAIALNAKIFSEIIRKLPDDIVTIETNESYATTITSGKAKFNISGQNIAEFPELPQVAKTKCVSISQHTLKEIIQQTVFSISQDENNKMMTGELFEIEKNILKVCTLDGHRISIRKVELSKEYDPVKVIVPGKTLNEFGRILSGDAEKMVSIYFTDKHILFEFDETMVVSRLIEGQYYKIDKMLSNDFETKLTVNKSELLECIERSTLIINENDKRPLILKITDNNMELNIVSSIGQMHEDILVNKDGADLTIGFNPKFLIDALKVIDDEQIVIYLFNSKGPCSIKDKDESYIYLILPVNIIV